MASIFRIVHVQSLVASGIVTFVVLAFSLSWLQVLSTIKPSTPNLNVGGQSKISVQNTNSSKANRTGIQPIPGSEPNTQGAITQSKVSNNGTPSPDVSLVQFCTGVNKKIPNGACEAIYSIQSNPTDSNPRLNDQVLNTLALMPGGTTITIDENSWRATSSSGGSVTVTASTPEWGAVSIELDLEDSVQYWSITRAELQS